MDKKFDEYPDNERIETFKGADMTVSTLEGVDIIG